MIESDSGNIIVVPVFRILKKRVNRQMRSGDSIDMFFNLPDMASVA